MALHKRDGGLERLGGLCAMLDDHLLVGLTLDGEVFVDFGIRTAPQDKPHDKSDAQLSHNLEFAGQTFLVVTEYLDVVVEKTEKSQPNCGDNHQDEIDVAHTTEQNHRYKDGHDDDDATHRRHTNLLHAKGVDLHVALCLADLFALEKLDELFAEPCRDDQRQDECQQCPEGNIAPYMTARDAKLFQESE